MDSDALSEMRRYRRAMPGAYNHIFRDLEALNSIMTIVQQYLDSPEPKGRAVSADLLRRIADALDNQELPIPYAN